MLTDAWIIARAGGWLLIRPIGMLGHAMWRVLPWVTADSLIAATSFFIAYFLRFLDTARPYGAINDATVIRAIALTSLGFAVINLCFRLHRRAWRYAAGVEVLPIAVAVLIVGVVIAGIPLAMLRRRSAGQVDEEDDEDEPETTRRT